jgi:Zn-dependent peptidase ImmA (M78 family)
MSQLYTRLAAINVDKPFVKNVVLPDWWDDEMAATDAGYARGLGIISQHLGVDLRQLWDDTAPIKYPACGKTNFKLNASLTKADVEWAKSVALSAAKFAARETKQPLRALPSAKSIRDQIIKAGASCVDLPRLLEFLWDHGIPVLHIDAKPKGAKKMAGLAARIEGRPVIVLSKNHPYNSLMLFDLAHELGHILRKHIDGDAVLIDAKIERDGQTDPQEVEANEAALEVLTGRTTLQFTHRNRYVKGEALAKMAVATGKTENIDPGVVAQNFAFGRDFFAVAGAACKIIEGDKSPVRLIEQMLLNNVDFANLADEDAEFLMKVAVTGEPNAVAAR